MDSYLLGNYTMLVSEQDEVTNLIFKRNFNRDEVGNTPVEEFELAMDKELFKDFVIDLTSIHAYGCAKSFVYHCAGIEFERRVTPNSFISHTSDNGIATPCIIRVSHGADNIMIKVFYRLLGEGESVNIIIVIEKNLFEIGKSKFIDDELSRLRQTYVEE